MPANRVLTEYTTVAMISTGILSSEAVQAASQNLMRLLGEIGLPESVLRMLLNIGIFTLIFKACITIYYALLWRRVNAFEYVGGQWTYVYNDSYVPNGEEDADRGTWDKKMDQHGRAYFSHSVENLQVSGESFGLVSERNDELVATWESTAAGIKDRRINLTVEIRTSDGSREGYVTLHVIPASSRQGVFSMAPKELLGHFYLYDSKRARPYARIRFTRGESVASDVSNHGVPSKAPAS
jgi:hypothetical protein